MKFVKKNTDNTYHHINAGAHEPPKACGGSCAPANGYGIGSVYDLVPGLPKNLGRWVGLISLEYIALALHARALKLVHKAITWL